MPASLAILLAVLGAWLGESFSVSNWEWERASADTYTVEEGDTLWDIANSFSIPVSVLRELNPGIGESGDIYAGQNITVPDNVGASAASGPPAFHTVRPGDTLSAIAETYGTTVTAILALNPGLEPRRLQEDAKIAIPARAPEPAPAPAERDESSPQRSINAGVATPQQPSDVQLAEYVVKPGDHLYGIAEHAGISFDELIAHNPDVQGGRMLHPGDIIYIPTPNYRVPAIDPREAGRSITMPYVVRSGDNATMIAERFEISLAELRSLNGGESLNTIFEGQTLNVPWSPNAATADAGTVPAVERRRRTYRVQSGDTFYDIAQRHGLGMEELRALNPTLRVELLLVDQLLYLPGHIDLPVVSEARTLNATDLVQYAAAQLGVTPHTLIANHGWLEPGQWLEAGTSWRLPLREGLLVTVQRGDTLQAIANRHGVDMQAILDDPAHGVDDPNEIVIGQEIILPLSLPEFVWPAQGEITDPFGLCRSWDCSYRHKGLDIALDYSEPILAIADGVVTFVGGDETTGLGWYVEIDHGGGWSSVSAHLSEFAVWEGQEVEAGDIVGYNGNSGYSTGPHLHLEVHHNDWYVDPLVVLP